MITCLVPVEEDNELAKFGSLNSTIHSIMEELVPEAAYFSDIEGGRVGYIVVNIEDTSQIAASRDDSRGLEQSDPGNRASVPEGRLERRVRTESSYIMLAGALDPRPFLWRKRTFHVLP